MEDSTGSRIAWGSGDGMGVVRGWIESNDYTAEFGEEGRDCHLQFASDAVDLLVRIVGDLEDDASLCVFVHPSFSVPEGRRGAVVEACNLINVAMLLGSVEFDLEVGRARYRYLLAYPPGELDSELFGSLMDGLLDSANRSMKALLAVSLGTKSPAEAAESLQECG